MSVMYKEIKELLSKYGFVIDADSSKNQKRTFFQYKQTNQYLMIRRYEKEAKEHKELYDDSIMLLSGLKVAFPLFSGQDFTALSSAVIKEPSANNNHNKFFGTSKPHSLTVDVKDIADFEGVLQAFVQKIV